MALPEDFLYQLKENSPIQEVMSRYVNVIRRGRTCVCLCPFHSEKSPSCTIYPDSNSFYCFGCGAGGDAITFIRKIENLDYIEAVRLLAERAGIAMPEDRNDNRTAGLRTRILEINREAARFYYEMLRHTSIGEKCRRYLVSRQLSPATVKKYGLGYVPDSWTALHDHLRSKEFTEQEMLNASLCGRSTKTGRLYDLFRDRLMFPIIDPRGRVIAFGGRILDGEGPKYLNSGETLVFHKSRNLFSLNFAKNDKSQRLILAEGYMDVISINQAGFENVVATLGTALTPEQARMMAQYAQEVIIAYDSDEAGQKATHKAINLLGEAGVTAKIIRMEGAKDPDEYIKKNGAGRFKLLLDQSGGAISFELDKCAAGLEMDTDAGRVEYLRRAVRVLADIASPVERDVYISRIAREQDISREALRAQVDGWLKKKNQSQRREEWQKITAAPRKPDRVNPEAVKYLRESRAEQTILAGLILHPEQADWMGAKLPPEKFVTSFHQKVYCLLLERLPGTDRFSLDMLSDALTLEEMAQVSGILAKSRLNFAGGRELPSSTGITLEEMNDCVELLLRREELSIDPQNLSDEELLRLQQAYQKKQKKKI